MPSPNLHRKCKVYECNVPTDVFITDVMTHILRSKRSKCKNHILGQRSANYQGATNCKRCMQTDL